MLALGSRSSVYIIQQLVQAGRSFIKNNRVVEGTKIWGIRNLGGVCGRAPGVGRVHLQLTFWKKNFFQFFLGILGMKVQKSLGIFDIQSQNVANLMISNCKHFQKTQEKDTFCLAQTHHVLHPSPTTPGMKSTPFLWRMGIFTSL